jgi:hypothetical protein
VGEPLEELENCKAWEDIDNFADSSDYSCGVSPAASDFVGEKIPDHRVSGLQTSLRSLLIRNKGLEDRGVKLAAWHLMAVGTLLLAAGSLRAQTPETLPEPSNPSSIFDQSSSSLLETPTEAHPSDASIKLTTPNEIMDDSGAPVPDQKPFSASSGYWWRDGSWYGDFDFVIWSRTRPKSKVLAAEENSSNQIVTLLNAKGHQLPLEAGGRGTLGYFLGRDVDNRDHSIDFTYLGFNNWEGADSIRAAAGNTITIGSPTFPGFSNAGSLASTYRSDFQSMELDYRIRNRPGRDEMLMGPDGFWSQHLTQGHTESLFVGLRGISEEEQYHMLGSSNPVSPTTFNGDYQLNTKNHLLGFQVGGDFYDVHEGWYWGLKGDAGIYCNFANGSAHVVGLDAVNVSPTPTVVNGSTTAQTASFLGELSFVAGYNINDHLMVHAGWDLVQVGGLDLAADEVSFSSNLLAKTPFMVNDGQIFFNGLSVGLEAYW